MDRAVLDCLVNDYAERIPNLQLTDPDDHHVLFVQPHPVNCFRIAMTFSRTELDEDGRQIVARLVPTRDSCAATVFVFLLSSTSQLGTSDGRYHYAQCFVE
jgi:hypothetical protein